jgi:hypothetical protein
VCFVDNNLYATLRGAIRELTTLCSYEGLC